MTVSSISGICCANRFTKDSLQSRLSVTLPSAVSVSLREPCSAMLFVCNSRISSYCSEVAQSTMDFENLPDSSISLRNVVVPSDSVFIFLDFVWKLRPDASALGSHVDDDDDETFSRLTLEAYMSTQLVTTRESLHPNLRVRLYAYFRKLCTSCRNKPLLLLMPHKRNFG